MIELVLIALISFIIGAVASACYCIGKKAGYTELLKQLKDADIVRIDDDD